MAKNLDNYLADRVLTRQLYLMRFSAGEKKKVLAVLVDMRAELVAKLRGFRIKAYSIFCKNVKSSPPMRRLKKSRPGLPQRARVCRTWGLNR